VAAAWAAVASHVQVRGSVPLLWGHPAHIRYRAPLEMEAEAAVAPAATASAFAVAAAAPSGSEQALRKHVRRLLDA
jgi:hypothetical protein